VTSNGLVTSERENPRADVLVVTSGWPHEDNSAYGIFIKRQTDSLIAKGLRCDVLFIRGYRSWLAYPLAALRLLSWSFSRKVRYRLIHAHGAEAASAAAFYRRAPLLVSYLGSDLLGRPRPDGSYSRPERIRRALLRRQSRLAAHTITKSREMESALPVGLRSRNSVLPNGVDTARFRPIDQATARRELGLPLEGRMALFAADPDIACKRYGLAAAAVDDARRKIQDLRLEVVRGVAPDRMPFLMNAADCLLLTSSTEGSPNVVKEALMCNLPVVATPAGDVAELLEGVTPSYVCEPTEAALAEALVECLESGRRSNGREVSGRLDARVVADSLLAIYKHIAPDIELDSSDRSAGSGRPELSVSETNRSP
jgi:glycosyltransferase involved in cell wall biosynthesis